MANVVYLFSIVNTNIDFFFVYELFYAKFDNKKLEN